MTYQRSQYQEWCGRVSDILAQNLTRPLLKIAEGPRVKKDEDEEDEEAPELMEAKKDLIRSDWKK